MDARTFWQVQQIMSLAMQLNPTETRQETTGSRPTVFVQLSGHTCGLYVEVFAEGWKADVPSTYRAALYLEDDPHDALGAVIDLLEKLCVQWKDKEVAS